MIGRLAGGVAVLAVLAGGAFWMLTQPASLSDETLAALSAHDADAQAGEAVFWAAGCASCHSAPDLAPGAAPEARMVLTGGRSFPSDFGTFYAPNISPDPEHGIGDWTLPQFAHAVMQGVSPEGAHYYPAFPYTTYIHATPGDIADLWAFWQTLPADATPSRAHDVGFPFSFRRGLGLWKRFNLHDDYATPAFDDAELARGQYLVEALGHCAECHTPRDALGGLERGQWLAGAPNPAGEGRIPALPPEGWSAFDIAAYLETGFTPEFDTAGGEMADVIDNMSRIAAPDRAAIAAYLVALRSSPNP
ncbi:diacylglycerol kinase [Pararhodobacter marinus]|uniref:Diacylglycerol kinase n=1 Tax=Pararhodobacter marinus TaxID=2184063 RepID=A0A2U2CGE9_9RHOB|nr:cytochrome c [Pararhodobacter marinus]PWE30921.1 diacylglycerol kinase [Pararhodobacter marinus]